MNWSHKIWRILMAGVSSLQVLGAAPSGLFERVDKNGDGVITRDELPNQALFARFDTDGSGLITRQEALRAVGQINEGGAATRAGNPITPGPRTSGPDVLNSSETNVGRQVSDREVTDLSGRTLPISSRMGPKGLVVAFTSTTCPVSRRYIAGLAELEKSLNKNGIHLLLVDPYPSDDREEMLRLTREHHISAPWVHDIEKSLSSALAAKTTTEVFLLDHTRTMVYRGALDDQFGADYSRDKPRHTYLRDAVEALLESRVPTIVATSPPGCEIDSGPPSGPVDGGLPSATDPTYHRDVARILRQHCVRCHHTGGIAPFALDHLQGVRDRVRAIRRVLEEQSMPPWFAHEPSNAPSRWRNDASLPARDRRDLLKWLNSSDKPVGDVMDAPVPLKFERGWSMGTPDWIVPGSRHVDVPGTGTMPYQMDLVETGLTEDRWVSGYEILPEVRSVVHHVLVRVVAPGQNARNEGEGTGYWAAYVPGNSAHRYPEGFARKLPAGSRMSFQIHYTPNGTAVRDRIQVGLFFSRKPPENEVKTLPLANLRISIPPGAPEHLEEMTRKAPFDIPLLAFMPHMHMRGTSFRYEHIRSDGSTDVLLDIPRYDFNWQLRYDLKVPRVIPSGDRVRIAATYDNSERNRANPDPTKTVKWGPQTSDEMMIGYVEYYTPVGR